MAREIERHKLAALRDEVMSAGGEKKIDQQHQQGKMTARERIEALLDADSFIELDQFVAHRGVDFGMADTVAPDDGVVTGYGMIDGRLVYLFVQDATVLGGSLGEMHAAKICKVIDKAVTAGVPLIGIHESGGARVQEGLDALNGYGEIFRRSAQASGVIPQIAVVLGACAGSAAFIPALSDFTIIVDKADMFVNGPQVTKAVTGKDMVSDGMANSKNGNAHIYAADEAEALTQLKRLLSFLPDNNLVGAPVYDCGDSLYRADDILPQLPPDGTSAYDIKTVIEALADDRDFLEVQEQWAANLVAGFIRLNGVSVGVVANQPLVDDGDLDIEACDKAARFVRYCDAFAIPLLTVVDTVGYRVGVEQEQGGLARHSARLIAAYAEATVPKLTLIVGKAIGGAYLALGSKALGADTVVAWPSAQIALAQPDAVANIVYREEVASAADPKAALDDKTAAYVEQFAGPFAAARRGLVDAVLEQEQTRGYLIRSLDALLTKKELRPGKKHSNLPC